jgi:hypothetical protein
MSLRKEASGLRLFVRVSYTQEVRGSNPLPPTTNSATKCSHESTTDLLEKFIASRPEGSSKRTIEVYRINVHWLGSELLNYEGILRFSEQPANDTNRIV